MPARFELAGIMEVIDSSFARLWTFDILTSEVGKSNRFIKESQVSCDFFLIAFTCVTSIEV